jgi:hypothetical protein
MTSCWRSRHGKPAVGFLLKSRVAAEVGEQRLGLLVGMERTEENGSSNARVGGDENGIGESRKGLGLPSESRNSGSAWV